MVDTIRHDSPVLIIGLGRFGEAIAEQLDLLDREVLAIDTNPVLVQQWADRVTHTVQGDARSLETLQQIGAADFDIAVVAVGASIESSVLVAANLVDLGVPNIWAKAMSLSHGTILQRIGVHHVIYPEREAGERVAHLVSGKMLDFIAFDDDLVLVKMFPPVSIQGMPSAVDRLRTKYRVTLVGVKSPGEPFHTADANTVLRDGDVMIVSGTGSDIERFATVVS